MEISNMRKVNYGKLRAFFRVTWPGKMEVNDFKLIEGNNGELFCRPPDRQYEKDGEKKWAPIVSILDENLRQKITDAARAEYYGDQHQEDIPY